MIIQGKRNSENKLYTKIKTLWHHMMNRCYNPSNHAYKNYGAKGVTVCEEWKTLNGFIDTVDNIKGWDLGEFLEGNLTLDKDFLIKGNKLYSPETCCFILKSENNKIKPNQQQYIIGISPTGEEVEFFNQSEFSRENNLRQSTINDCLSGRVRVHRGWKFKYKTM